MKTGFPGSGLAVALGLACGFALAGCGAAPARETGGATKPDDPFVTQGSIEAGARSAKPIGPYSPR